MAVSLLSCPSSCKNCRTTSEHLCARQLERSITFFSICFQKRQRSFKLCLMMPNKARHALSRAFAASVGTVGAVDAQLASLENHVSSDGSTSDDFLSRASTLFGNSSNCPDDVRELVAQLQGLFDEVKAMIVKGRRNDAADLLQANYQLVKEQINAGARGFEEAAMLDTIALGCLGLGDVKFARLLLNKLNEIVGSLKGDEPLIDSVLVHMASMYSALGKSEKSIHLYKRVIGILEGKYGKSSMFLVSSLLGMAKVFSSIGRATKAVELYNRSITIMESSKGAESEDLVLPLFCLGNLLMKEGRASNAEDPFLRILDIYMKLYGEKDGKVGTALCSLAHVNWATGNEQKAIDLYRKALQVIKDAKYMAPDDHIMEKMRTELAELLHSVGRVKEGRDLIEECLLITEKHKGRDHPSLVTHLINLATSYSQTKDFVEAERLLRTSVEIMKKNGKEDDQSITFPMLHLAVTLYHLNQDEEAEQLALKVLRIRERAFGKDSIPVGEALDSLVCIQTRLETCDDSELLEMLQRVLKIQEREFGFESEEVMNTLLKILFFLDRTGNKNEKFLIERRLSELKNKYKQKLHK